MVKMKHFVTALAVSAMCLLAPMQNVSAAESDNTGAQSDGQTYTQEYTLEVQSEDAVLGASYRTDFSKEINAEKVKDVKFYNVDGNLVMTYRLKNEDSLDSGWRNSVYYYENGESFYDYTTSDAESDGYYIFSVVSENVKVGDKIILYSYFTTYNSLTGTSDYTNEIVKFVTVKDVEEWKGSVSDYTTYVGNNDSSYYLDAYIPGDLQLSDSAYMAVYSGDGMVARSFGVLSKYASSVIIVDGVHAFMGGSSSFYNISSSVYPAKTLPAGKYSVKIVDGDKVYDLSGKFTVTDEKSVTRADRNAKYVADSPVAYVATRGYTGDELLVELVDKDGNVVATSTGGEFITDAQDCYYFKLKSEYKLDEINKMSNLKIVVKSLDGTELLSNRYYNSYGIQEMYYDYYDDCVYAATYGISDGTVVTASFKTDDVTYESEAVANNGRVFFYFTEDGQKLDLTSKISDGQTYEYFSISLSWKDEYDKNTSGSVYVRDVNRKTPSTYNTSKIEDWYPVGTTSITADVDISTSNLKDIELQEGTTFTFSISTSSYYSSSEYDKVEKIDAVVTPISKTYSSGEVAGFNFKADIPVEALEAGNYYVILTSKNGDTTYTRPYSFKVADLSYMYSYMYMTSRRGEDTPYLYINVPSYMSDTADVSKLTLNITDVLGNKTDVQLTYDADMSGKTSWYFAATGVDMDVNYYITANYNGNPMYSTDNSGLKREEVASRQGRFSLSDGASFVSLLTFKKDNYKEYVEEYQKYQITCYSDDLTLEIREAGRFDILKTMALKKGYNYFTKDFLAGLSYDKLQFQYDLRVLDADGKCVTSTTGYLASSNKAYEPFDKDEDNDTDTKLSGIVLAEDGNYYYYVDGAVATSFTGLAANDMGTFYFVNGKLDFSFNGFVYQNDTWWCVAGGRVCPDYTGLWSDATVGWWYVKDGKIDFSFNGFVPFGDAWWCVAGGRVCFDYTGLWSDANVGWWYVENGAINFGFNGYVPFADAWWCVAGGRVCFDYTGLWSDANVGWWYTENGAINFGFNGLVPFGDAWWCVAGGRVAFEYTGLWYDANVGWWYVENGVINFGFSGAVDYNGGTYNVVGGMVVFG